MTEERRAAPRVAVETFVKDLFRSAPEAGDGIIYRLVTNVSADGAFVVDRLHSLDPKCTLVIPVPDGAPVAVEAEVVRRTADGSAVRFTSLTDADRERLARVARATSRPVGQA
jgi:PilZ domain-containing protein